MPRTGQVIACAGAGKTEAISRELRTEDGYAIATKTTGRPDLRMGEYVLLATTRVAEPHDRYIPAEVQREVYARDHNTCRNPNCNWNIEHWTTADARILELHHLQAHVKRGPNTASNLIVLCSRCSDLTVGRPIVQQFVGSMDFVQANKGVIITTSQFSKEAYDFIHKIVGKKVVLIDGEQVAALMLEYNIGVNRSKVYEVKELSNDFFDEDNG